MKHLGSFLIGLVGAFLALALSLPIFSYLPIASSANLQGLSMHEMAVLGDTRRSHFLLPDGRFSVELGNPAQQAEHSRLLQELFPEPSDYQAVLAWGEKLFESTRAKYRANQQFIDTEPKFNPGFQDTRPPELIARVKKLLSEPVTDDLRAHAAWRRLQAAPGVSVDDLRNLQTIVSGAVRSPSDLQALRTWAKQRHRQKEHTLSMPSAEFTGLVRPVPPDLPWFEYWTIYEDWCVTESMHAARWEALDRLFGSGSNMGMTRRDALLAVGRQAVRTRSKQTEHALPLPDTEQAALIAALDLLGGIDPVQSPPLAAAGKKAFEKKHLLVGSPGYGQGVLDEFVDPWNISFPNDELFIGYFGPQYARGKASLVSGINEVFEPYAVTDTRDPQTALPKVPERVPTTGFPLGLIVLVPALLALAWLLLRGLAVLTVIVPGYLLGLRQNSQFVQLRESLQKYEQVSLLAIPLAAYVSYRYYLLAPDPLAVVWTMNSWAIFVSLLVAGVFGGLMFDGVRNLLTVLMIRLGIDVSKSWWDELLGFALVSVLLLFLQNSTASILCSTLIGLLAPWTVYKLHRMTGATG